MGGAAGQVHPERVRQAHLEQQQARGPASSIIRCYFAEMRSVYQHVF